MEHSLHLGAGHFVKEVAPTPSRNILKKVQHAPVDEDHEGTADEDNEGELEAADSIGKALALVNQVSTKVLGSSILLTIASDSQVTTGARVF
jgi:hypothetical protein